MYSLAQQHYVELVNTACSRETRLWGRRFKLPRQAAARPQQTAEVVCTYEKCLHLWPSLNEASVAAQDFDNQAKKTLVPLTVSIPRYTSLAMNRGVNRELQILNLVLGPRVSHDLESGF